MTAVVLSGEGARGPFQWGALQYLISNGLEVSKLYGISSGGLTTALASQVEPEAVTRTLNGITSIHSLFDFNYLFPFGEGFYKTGPLKLILENLLKTARLPVARRRPGVVSYVDIEKGTLIYKDVNQLTDKEIIEAVLSAVSIPGLIVPYKWPYIDAGTMEINPVTYALSQGETSIAVIIGRPSTPTPYEKPHGLFKGVKIAYKALDLMMHASCMDDMLSGALSGCEADIQLIEPIYPLGDTLDFTKAKDSYSVGIRGRYKRTDVVKAMRNL